MRRWPLTIADVVDSSGLSQVPAGNERSPNFVAPVPCALRKQPATLLLAGSELAEAAPLGEEAALFADHTLDPEKDFLDPTFLAGLALLVGRFALDREQVVALEASCLRKPVQEAR